MRTKSLGSACFWILAAVQIDLVLASFEMEVC